VLHPPAPVGAGPAAGEHAAHQRLRTHCCTYSDCTKTMRGTLCLHRLALFAGRSHRAKLCVLPISVQLRTLFGIVFLPHGWILTSNVYRDRAHQYCAYRLRVGQPTSQASGSSRLQPHSHVLQGISSVQQGISAMFGSMVLRRLQHCWSRRPVLALPRAC